MCTTLTFGIGYFMHSHTYFFLKVLSRALQKHPRDLPGVSDGGQGEPAGSTPPHLTPSSLQPGCCSAYFRALLKNGTAPSTQISLILVRNGKCWGVFLRSILSLVGEFGKGRWTFEANGAGEGGGQFSPSPPSLCGEFAFWSLFSDGGERSCLPVGAQSHPTS